MSPQNKIAVAITAGLVVTLIFILLASNILADVEEPAEHGAAVGEQLWSERTVEMMVLAVMIFAGVLGILALVGDELKWQ
jgi:hypothetical protein